MNSGPNLKILAIILCFFIVGLVRVVSADSGITTAHFLTSRPGARALGMGGAFTAISGDALAVYWNPAGMSGLDSLTLGFSWNQFDLDVNQSFISFAMPLPVTKKKKHFLGGAVNLYRIPGYTEADANWQAIQRDGKVNSSISGAYGFKVSPSISFGGSLKYVNQNIEEDSGSGIGYDAGAQFHFFGQVLHFGFVAQNFGPKLKFKSGGAYMLPTEYRAGTALKLGRHFILATDFVHPVDNKSYFTKGVETAFGEKGFMLRAGHNGIVRSWARGYTVGLGYSGMAFSVDYAYSGYGVAIGNAHRFTLGYKFGSWHEGVGIDINTRK
jgi:hypothetical protein